MLPTKFRFTWQSGFRRKDFKKINQSNTRIVCGGHVYDFFIFFSTETVWPMKSNLVGSIYGKSSVAIAHFVPIRLKPDRHKQFLHVIG
jgi:hypothetical protein